jgi:hypothetical protein
MKPAIPLRLGVEDELSGSILRRVLAARPRPYAIGPVYGREGFGYLKRQAAAFNNAARGGPFLVLTDLDRSPCPSQLIAEWLPLPKHRHLLLRVAVREVESWLLADDEGLGRYLGLRRRFACAAPEELADPKAALLELALASARRALRDALVARDEEGGRLRPGPDYNGALARFVYGPWNLTLAASRCRSLARLQAALGRLEEDF